MLCGFTVEFGSKLSCASKIPSLVKEKSDFVSRISFNSSRSLLSTSSSPNPVSKSEENPVKGKKIISTFYVKV